jgi:hypothetical protein
MSSRRPSRAVTRTHEHAASLRSFLQSFYQTANAASIMTPWPEVKSVAAQSVDSAVKARAKDLMDSRHFSAVPLVWESELTGVFIRNGPNDSPRFERAKQDHFVDPQIGLIDLLRGMRNSEWFVVSLFAS